MLYYQTKRTDGQASKQATGQEPNQAIYNLNQVTDVFLLTAGYFLSW